MKKRLFAFLAALAAAFTLAVSASADETGITIFVFDEIGCLSSSELQQLDSGLEALSDGYGFGIAVAYVDGFGGLSQDQYAQKLFEDMNVGYGVGENGVLLVICPKYNTWEYYRSGIGVPMFTKSVTNELDDFIGSYVSQERFYDVGCKFGTNAEAVLISNGRTKVTSDTEYSDFVGSSMAGAFALIPCFLIGMVVGLIVMSIPLSKMKSVEMQKAAFSYVVPDSFRLYEQSDTFLGNDRRAAYKVLGEPEQSNDLTEQQRQFMAALEEAKAQNNTSQKVNVILEAMNQINNQQNKG